MAGVSGGRIRRVFAANAGGAKPARQRGWRPPFPERMWEGETSAGNEGAERRPTSRARVWVMRTGWRASEAPECQRGSVGGGALITGCEWGRDKKAARVPSIARESVLCARMEGQRRRGSNSLPGLVSQCLRVGGRGRQAAAPATTGLLLGLVSPVVTAGPWRELVTVTSMAEGERIV